MNKLMGFYELKATGIPSIKWEEFKDDSKLSNDMLWTVRAAVFNGYDYNLPRIVGVAADVAVKEARGFKERLKDNGLIIYYPYFTADKSGVLKVSGQSIVIEAVEKDLWNLVTYGNRDVTMIIKSDGYTEVSGNPEFLTKDEVDELKNYSRILLGKYRDDIAAGRELYLEWSYAYNSSIEGKPYGERYLLFYEMRVI